MTEGGVQKHQISDDVICDCERSPIVNAMPYAAICHITTVLVVVVHQHVVDHRPTNTHVQSYLSYTRLSYTRSSLIRGFGTKLFPPDHF